jgi:hypothetical protein
MTQLRTQRVVAGFVLVVALTSCGKSETVGSLGSASPGESPLTTPSATSATESPQPSKLPTPAVSQTLEPASTDDAKDSGIKGEVVAGPTCPVERVDSPCPDKPVAHADVTVKGEAYHANTTTNAQGRFKVDPPPGTYTVTVTSDSVFGCDEKTVKVEAHQYTNVTIECDTGMR